MRERIIKNFVEKHFKCFLKESEWEQFYSGLVENFLEASICWTDTEFIKNWDWKDYYYSISVENVKEFLVGSFTWADTKQGKDYWDKINQKIIERINQTTNHA